MTAGPLADPARAAATAAALELVQPGMIIGLGSGRAVFALVELIGTRLGPAPPLRAVVASERTAALARTHGIELAELDGTLRLDVTFDGADEIDPDLGLIKGGGGALLREKLVVGASERFVVIAEATKLSARLGTLHALPVEVVRFAWADTRRRVLELVPSASLRLAAGDTPFVTDEGHFLLDCALPPGDVHALGQALKATVGVVEHGLFLGVAEQALVGEPGGSVRVLRPHREG
jgi:ribose 5-phosphate isomerase A